MMVIMERLNKKTQVRSGCKDVWNAFMAEDAVFGKYDIPYCFTMV